MGHDKLMKIFFPFVSSFITHLFKTCLKILYFPRIWKKGNFRIFLKTPGGDMGNPKNYLPVTLLSELAKTFEKVIKKRLKEEINHFHSNKQFGFNT